MGFLKRLGLSIEVGNKDTSDTKNDNDFERRLAAEKEAARERIAFARVKAREEAAIARERRLAQTSRMDRAALWIQKVQQANVAARKPPRKKKKKQRPTGYYILQPAQVKKKKKRPTKNKKKTRQQPSWMQFDWGGFKP